MTLKTSDLQFNHLSFPSNDVARTAAFFETYMGCTVAAKGGNEETSYEFVVLKRGTFDIVIESPPGDIVWPAAFHIGLEVDTVADVHALHEQFKAGGVEMVLGYQGSTGEVFNNSRGSRFYCRAPGGPMFEVHTREDVHERWKGSFDSQKHAQT